MKSAEGLCMKFIAFISLHVNRNVLDNVSIIELHYVNPILSLNLML
jgi:hypothetical protein